MRVAINGFGRIGRLFLRAAMSQQDISFDVIAIHDWRVGDPNRPEAMVYLYNHDTSHGRPDQRMRLIAPSRSGSRKAKLCGQEIYFCQSHESLPDWGKLGVDIVLDASGAYLGTDMGEIHVQKGAKAVVLTAPASKPDATLIYGVNEGSYDPNAHQVISAASCTSNCVIPILAVLSRNLGIKEASLVSVNAYTSNQRLVDQPHVDLRRSRAAAQNIIPTDSSTGDTVETVLPELSGHFRAFAYRVPVLCGSVCHLDVQLARSSTALTINRLLKGGDKLCTPSVVGYWWDDLVSSDVIGSSQAAIVDAKLTECWDDHARVVAWYDNEWGYASQLVRLMEYIASRSG